MGVFAASAVRESDVADVIEESGAGGLVCQSRDPKLDKGESTRLRLGALLWCAWAWRLGRRQ